MRSLKAPYKDWRRRRELERRGIRPVLHVPDAALIGARSGTWATAPAGLGPDAFVVSGGVGDNVGWDLGVIARFGCAVHAFDPTPRSCAWLAERELPAEFRHRAIGLAAKDGARAFAPPSSLRSVDFAMAPADVELSARAEMLPVRRLATIAAECDREHVDLLKLDVEGAEYEILADVLANGPRVDQLLVEFHHGTDRWTIEHTARAVGALRDAGLRCFWISRRGLEMSFLRCSAPQSAGWSTSRAAAVPSTGANEPGARNTPCA